MNQNKDSFSFRGVTLPVSEELFQKYWKYDKDFFIRYLEFLNSEGFNSICFWSYSSFFEPPEFVNYLRWLIDETSRRGIQAYLHGAGQDEQILEKIYNNYPKANLLIKYYEGQTDGFFNWLGILKKHKVKCPFLIVDAYLNSPVWLKRAKDAFFKEFPAGKFWATFKYSFEHFSANGPTPDSKLFAEAVGGNLITWLQVCGDFDPFSFFNPEYIRDCLAGCKTMNINGFMFMPPHWWTFPCTTDKLHKQYSWEKDVLWYESFGKYGKDVNFNGSRYWPERFRSIYNTRPEYYEAVKNVSLNIPLVSELFWYSVDFQYHPQMASNFYQFVPPEIYAGLPPRLDEHKPLVYYIKNNQQPPHVDVAQKLAQASDNVLSISGNRKGCVERDARGMAYVGKFWSDYILSMTKMYEFARDGDTERRKEAIESLENAFQYFKNVSSESDKHYDHGYRIGIWGQPVDWKQVIPGFESYKKKLIRRLNAFERLPVMVSGEPLLHSPGWFWEIWDWPFDLCGIDFFPVFKILPFFMKKKTNNQLKLLIVRKSMEHLLEYKKEVLAWVNSGGHLLFYDVHKDFVPEFFPDEIHVRFLQNCIFRFRNEQHKLLSGLELDQMWAIGRPSICSDHFGKDWKSLVFAEELDQATPVLWDKERPAALLSLKYGKGEIAVSGVRVNEIGYKNDWWMREKRINEKTVIEKTIVNNWFAWAGIGVVKK